MSSAPMEALPRGSASKKAVIIRFSDEREVDLITSAAHENGISREEFLRLAALRAAQQPILRQKYALWAWGGGNRVKLTRNAEGAVVVDKTGKALTATQLAATEQAEQAMRRNARGDREQAITALGRAFDDVEERPA